MLLSASVNQWCFNLFLISALIAWTVRLLALQHTALLEFSHWLSKYINKKPLEVDAAHFINITLAKQYFCQILIRFFLSASFYLHFHLYLHLSNNFQFNQNFVGALKDVYFEFILLNSKDLNTSPRTQKLAVDLGKKTSFCL